MQSLTSDPNCWINTSLKLFSIVIDTDAGGDPDDIIALNYASKAFDDRIKLIMTTGFHSDVKAKICTLVCHILGMKSSVSAGYGLYKGYDNTDWEKLYPSWPGAKFGIPGVSDPVHQFHAVPYRHHFPEFDEIPVKMNSAVDELVNVCKVAEDHEIVMIAQAPLSNIAAAIQKAPEIRSKIARIVMMGGWFESVPGKILRLGYNTAIDLKAARVVLEQEEIRVVIINSAVVSKYRMSVRENELTALLGSECKTQFGEALGEDIRNYQENKTPKGELNLADALTAYLANHPDAIAETRPVRIRFNDELLDVKMFDPRSKDVIRVEYVQESNIHVVTELHDPAGIRKELVKSLARLFFLNLPDPIA